MKNYTAFKDGEVLLESDYWVSAVSQLKGAIIRYHLPLNVDNQVYWYECDGTNVRGYPSHIVPAWIRAWELIL